MYTKDQLEECLKNTDESLELDENNSCIIDVKGIFEIALSYDEQSGYVLAFCEIGKIPQDKELKLSITKELLTANFLWRDTLGGTISIHKDEDVFIFQNAYLNNTLDEFDNFLESTANKCELWISRYESLINSFSLELSDQEDEETFILEDEEINMYSNNDSDNNNNNQTIILDA